jgi:hypothetical protein
MRIDFDTEPLNAPVKRPPGGKVLRDTRPQLADTIPPVEPPPPVLLAQPKAHRVVAWRHDGGIDNTSLATLELAREYAARCHWAIYYKTMIMCGREMVARALIEEPRQ